MTQATEPQLIDSTAGKVAAESARRGIAPDQHVTITAVAAVTLGWHSHGHAEATLANSAQTTAFSSRLFRRIARHDGRIDDLPRNLQGALRAQIAVAVGD